MTPPSRSTGTTPVRILQSFGTPGPRTNPYFTQLFASTRDAVQRPFSWRTALFSRYDVLHLHFVDVVFLRTSRLKSIAGGILFVALMLRCRVSGIAIVRTLHNTATHEKRHSAAQALERLSARWTTVWIRLNRWSEPPRGAAVETILHGDYRDWFSRWPTADRRDGRIVFFGLIREYKGVDHLIEQFSSVSDASLELRIVGRPASEELASRITDLLAADHRVSALLDYVDDETLAREIGQAQLVVLPYLDMHNSGAAILGLSLNRPILVPDNPMNADLAAEVGSDWVQRYDGKLTGDDLANAVAATSREPESSHPDLSGRGWDVVGARHVDAYRRAVAIVSERRHHARRYSE
ncbi:MAG: glycosyltransferase [Mycetocola sp.]